MMKRPTAIKRHKMILTGFKSLIDLLRILFGLLIYSFGVYMTIRANIGLTPWDCLAVGISRHTPLNYGGAMAAVSLAAIVIQLLLHERIGFATVLDAVITGNLTQLLCDISPYPENHSLWFGIIFMLFGFLFIALGMFVYMSAEYGCGPKDGLLIAIGKRLPKIPIGVVEILLWVLVTLIGWLLGGTVGIGTLISTFGAGAVMHLFYDVIGFEPRELHHRSIAEMMRGR